MESGEFDSADFAWTRDARRVEIAEFGQSLHQSRREI